MGCSKSKLPQASTPVQDPVAHSKDVKLDVPEDHAGAVAVAQHAAQPTPEHMAKLSSKGSNDAVDSTASPKLMDGQPASAVAQPATRPTGEEPSEAHGVSDEEDEEALNESISNEEWCEWLRKELQSAPAYAEFGPLLEECCEVAGRWRTRFWDRKAVWGRIRRARRFAKEVGEVVPVIAQVRAEVDKITLAPDAPKLVILDLCSGFGYLAMLLSELLPPEKVGRIVLVDKVWAPHNIKRKPHHLDPEHIDDEGWPIRLSTSHANLRIPSDRRALAKNFLSHGAPAMLLGVHLCGRLSLRCIELFNDCPGFAFLALKPCCLPDKLFAQRGDVFGVGAHCFPAAAVSVDGKWNKGRWVGRSGRDEIERKYSVWVDNLSKCVECDPDDADGGGGGGGGGEAAGGDGVTIRHHTVQQSWFLNSFIFASRPWSTDKPRSVDYNFAGEQTLANGDAASGADGTAPLPNTSNGCGLSNAQRRAVIEEWKEVKRNVKRERRAARWTDEQRARAEALMSERSSRQVRVSIEPLGRASLRLTCMLEVHEGIFLPLGRRTKGHKGAPKPVAPSEGRAARVESVTIAPPSPEAGALTANAARPSLCAVELKRPAEPNGDWLSIRVLTK